MSKRRLIFSGIVLILWLGLFPPVAIAQSPGEKQQRPSHVVPFRQGSSASLGREVKPSPIKMLSPGVFEIGGVRVLKKREEVVFPATVNLAKGLLEYLIVGRGGKPRKSLLKTAVEPYDLQIALLMLGLEGTPVPLGEQRAPGRPQGDPVTIDVHWKKDRRMKQAPIESWVMGRNEKGPMGPVNWVFTGSITSDGLFMAQVEKSIVAISRDPAAMIGNAPPDGTGYDVRYVNEKAVPPAGTRVLVIIRKQKMNQE